VKSWILVDFGGFWWNWVNFMNCMELIDFDENM
jgi:hypothetical protein